MAEFTEGPPPMGTDFSHLTPFEREKQEAMRRQHVDPLMDGQREIDEEQRRLREALAAREKLEAARLRESGKIFHLLCSKGADKKIRVVGMYSSTEELAKGIAAGVGAYAAAGQVLGTVEFNLALKVDQPPIEPHV